MENAADIKAWCEDQWNGRLLHSGHRNVFTQGAGGIATKAGANVTYKSKTQKAFEARFGIYNEKLRPVILAEATATPRNVEVAIVDSYGRPVKNGNKVQTEVKMLNEYRWPAHSKQVDAKADTVVASVPRKRVPKAKLEQAAAIIAKVPPDELAAFLAKFGLSLSLAASIASLDNAEMIARQFLRATL